MPTNLNIQLKTLNDADLAKLTKYLKVYHKTLEDLAEESLKRFLSSAEATFEDMSHCPNCYLTFGKEIPLKGLPLVEAEKRGMVRLGSDFARKYATDNQTYYVICLECFWWGVPDKKSL